MSSAGSSSGATIPVWRRLLYTGAVLAVFLALLEGALSLVSPVELWLRRDEISRASEGGRLIVALGDSVTMGFGLPREQAWPARLQGWLADRGLAGARAAAGVNPRQGWTVVNRAAGGSKLDHVVQRDEDWLAQRGPATHPIVLLMVGHNDLMSWSGMGGSAGGLAPPPGPPRWTPRLLRVLLWGVGMAREELPTDLFSKTDVDQFAEGVARLVSASRASGGELVLLTYLVPGEAASDQDPQLARLVHAKREHQLAINALLRQVAADRGLPLLDLARTLPVPATWDPDWFIDDIHLSPEGAHRVGEAVGTWLLTTNRLSSN